MQNRNISKTYLSSKGTMGFKELTPKILSYLEAQICFKILIFKASSKSSLIRVKIPNDCKLNVPKLQSVGFSGLPKGEILSFNIFRKKHVCPITCAF